MSAKIYLASPYTDESLKVMRQRFLTTRKVAAKLLARGLLVFSPLVYSVQMEKQVGKNWQAWQAFDCSMLDWCDELWILDLPGWMTSQGVREETIYARKLNKTIYHLDPKTVT